MSDPTNQIIWTQLDNESLNERTARLNETLHRIFFDGKEVCPASFLDSYFDGHVECRICGECSPYPRDHRFSHGTPRFLESLDAMQLIVESGKFAEVREDFYHWLESDKRPKYECRILRYCQLGERAWFNGKGHTRQEAFYVTALLAMGYSVIMEGQGERR